MKSDKVWSTLINLQARHFYKFYPTLIKSIMWKQVHSSRFRRSVSVKFYLLTWWRHPWPILLHGQTCFRMPLHGKIWISRFLKKCSSLWFKTSKHSQLDEYMKIHRSKVKVISSCAVIISNISDSTELTEIIFHIELPSIWESKPL